jgi:hypothetical protein
MQIADAAFSPAAPDAQERGALEQAGNLAELRIRMQARLHGLP